MSVFIYKAPDELEKVQIKIKKESKQFIEGQIKGTKIPFSDFAGQMLDQFITDQKAELEKMNKPKKQRGPKAKKEEPASLSTAADMEKTQSPASQKATKRSSAKSRKSEFQSSGSQNLEGESIQNSLFDEQSPQTESETQNWHTKKELTLQDSLPPVPQIREILAQRSSSEQDFSKLDPRKVQEIIKQRLEKGISMYSWENYMISHIAAPMLKGEIQE